MIHVLDHQGKKNTLGIQCICLFDCQKQCKGGENVEIALAALNAFDQF